MKEMIEIKLTEEQEKELFLLENEVQKADLDNNKGAIIAQVLPNQRIMYCSFMTHEEIIKLYNVLGQKLPE